MRGISLSILLFVPALVAGTLALHAASMTKLNIVVKTQAGVPVERAAVIVRWKANKKHPRRARRRSSGPVTAPGYAPVRQSASTRSF